MSAEERRWRSVVVEDVRLERQLLETGRYWA
jgi:hypothetical protein